MTDIDLLEVKGDIVILHDLIKSHNNWLHDVNIRLENIEKKLEEAK
jgi:hypothetical protein